MSRVKSRRSVLFVAGDLSGDHFSARLARLTAARHPDLVLHALAHLLQLEDAEKTRMLYLWGFAGGEQGPKAEM